MGSKYTKGSADAILYFDSFTLLKGMRFTGRASYNRNQTFPFYGFNGFNSVYNRDWQNDISADYKTRAFYKYDRSLTKLTIDLQDTISGTKWSWFAGWDLGYYKVGSVDIDRLNEGKSDDKKLPETQSLFDKYVDWGLISTNEANGGLINGVKLGMVYDSRNRLTNPSKGTWFELLYRYSPSWLGNESSHNKISIIQRQYFPLKQDRLVLAYRLWYHGTIGKEHTPFYAQNYLTASNFYEGFGGANTLRGIPLGRIMADDFLLTNVELRSILKRFKVMGQNWYVGANVFFDGGMITDPIDYSLTNVSDTDKALYFSDEKGSLHASAGLGLKFVMNENFAISAEWGKSIDVRDGDSGFYLQMSYLF
jgi:outer membrane protein assembly factor BamA